MTAIRITGGCQCGAVRYAIYGSLGRPSICHCRMCQKAFGSFYAPLVGAPGFELTRGDLGVFQSSDAVERGFCRDCGTPLTFAYVERNRITVSIGSLDDPSRITPEIQYGIESRLPFFEMLHTLPGERTEDGASRDELRKMASRQHPDHD